MIHIYKMPPTPSFEPILRTGVLGGLSTLSPFNEQITTSCIRKCGLSNWRCVYSIYLYYILHNLAMERSWCLGAEPWRRAHRTLRNSVVIFNAIVEHCRIFAERFLYCVFLLFIFFFARRLSPSAWPKCYTFDR